MTSSQADETGAALRAQAEIIGILMRLSETLRGSVFIETARALGFEITESKEPVGSRESRRPRRAHTTSRRGPTAQDRRAEELKKGGIPDRVFRVVSTANGSVSAARVLAKLQQRDPKISRVAVYGALHGLAERGMIKQEMIGNKASYSVARRRS